MQVAPFNELNQHPSSSADHTRSYRHISDNMRAIIIIEQEAKEREALVGLFKKWQNEIEILATPQESGAISIMSQQQVDLVLCDLHLPGKTRLKEFARLTHTYPHIPSIALLAKQSQLSDNITALGASYCLSKPLNETQLLEHVEELLEIEARGTVKGIPIHSFLQMLEGEGKTCTLEVRKKNDTGFLYVQDGNLIDAETKYFKGEKAAQQVLSWQKTLLKLRHFNGQRKLQIKKPLISIIMEAYQLKSEREDMTGTKKHTQKHQLPLQHMSTRGKKLPLELGSTMRLRFPGVEASTESTMVGLLQDKFFIVTNPQPHTDLDQLVGSPQRILIKYVENGKAFMFKSQLLQCVHSPSPLLIFEYPGVMHFHDLRKAKRTSIYIPSTFQQEDSKELYGALIDLSTTGSLYQLKHREKSTSPIIEINTSVLLCCLLPGIKEEQRIHGRVRNIKISDTETRVGVEFENLQPHIADIIGKYLYDLESVSS